MKTIQNQTANNIEILNILVRKGFIGIITIFNVFLLNTNVYAGNIAGSPLAKGAEKLFKDVSAWMLVIAPTVTVIAIGYYFIRKAMSDEQDHKKWNTRITTALLCGIGVVSASLILNMFLAYFK